jgi:ATP-dependent Lon protease
VTRASPRDQGNIKPLRSLTEPLQMAKDDGAKRALIPIENTRTAFNAFPTVVRFNDD